MGDDPLTDTIRLTFPDNALAGQVFGEHNSHLQRRADDLEISVSARGNTPFIRGDAVSAPLA